MNYRAYVYRSLFALTGLSVAAAASAQDMSDRAGKFEWSFQFNYADSKSASGGNGSQAEIDSSNGAGFNFAGRPAARTGPGGRR